jgi:hypothetical protein
MERLPTDEDDDGTNNVTERQTAVHRPRRAFYSRREASGARGQAG